MRKPRTSEDGCGTPSPRLAYRELGLRGWASRPPSGGPTPAGAMTRVGPPPPRTRLVAAKRTRPASRAQLRASGRSPASPRRAPRRPPGSGRDGPGSPIAASARRSGRVSDGRVRWPSGAGGKRVWRPGVARQGRRGGGGGAAQPRRGGVEASGWGARRCRRSGGRRRSVQDLLGELGDRAPQGDRLEQHGLALVLEELLHQPLLAGVGDLDQDRAVGEALARAVLLEHPAGERRGAPDRRALGDRPAGLRQAPQGM